MPTRIEWTQETWNPVTGCTKVSAGCANCYAERMARRLAGRYGYPQRPHHFDVTLHPERLEQPLRWRKPRTVFVCSMGDLFHEEVPTSFIADLWDVMAEAYRHIFQILTKRAGRLPEVFHYLAKWKNYKAPLPNIWLGVTAENQAAADERIPLLLQTPAAVRFVSCEPLVGAIDISKYFYAFPDDKRLGVRPQNMIAKYKPLHWLIIGGESGPGARPMHGDWARSLRNQAQAAGVPYFFKQWGAWSPDAVANLWSGIAKPPSNVALVDSGLDSAQDYCWMARVGKKAAGRLLDGREWNEMPVTAVGAEAGR